MNNVVITRINSLIGKNLFRELKKRVKYLKSTKVIFMEYYKSTTTSSVTSDVFEIETPIPAALVADLCSLLCDSRDFKIIPPKVESGGKEVSITVISNQGLKYKILISAFN